MPSKSVGKPGAEMERSRGWNKNDGHFTIRKWNGTKSYIEGLIPSIILGAESYEISNQGPVYFLTARYSRISGSGATTEEASELWQLDGEDFTKSIYAHPVAVALEAESEGILLSIKKHIDLGTNYDDIDDPEWALLTGDNISNAAELYDLLSKGTDSFRSSSYVLRRTRRASPAFAFGTEENINKIYTSAQIVALYSQIPAVLQSRMPATGYWLKGTPTTLQAADNKYEDSVTWTHAEDYSTLIYEVAT